MARLAETVVPSLVGKIGKCRRSSSHKKTNVRTILPEIASLSEQQGKAICQHGPGAATKESHERTTSAICTCSPGCGLAECHGPAAGPLLEQLVLQRPGGLDQFVEFRPSACLEQVVTHLRRQDVRFAKRRSISGAKRPVASPGPLPHRAPRSARIPTR